MLRIRNRTIGLLVVACELTLLSVTAEARLYRYEDANGRVVISNTVPQEAVAGGYQILNSQGRVVETVEPAPTEEELAARAAEAEAQRQAEIRRQQDLVLIQRYSGPNDAVRAWNRKREELEGITDIRKGNITVLQRQLESEQTKAADLQRAGREIPDSILLSISRLEGQIAALEQDIEEQAERTPALAKEYKADIERLEQITERPRTLPFEP